MSLKLVSPITYHRRWSGR